MKAEMIVLVAIIALGCLSIYAVLQFIYIIEETPISQNIKITR